MSYIIIVFEIACFILLPCSLDATVFEEASPGPSFSANQTQTTIILFGSTGDLASRYLWPGFYKLYLSKIGGNTGDLLRIYATGRRDEEHGRQALNSLLSSEKLCQTKASISNDEIDNCKGSITGFSKLFSYYRTKTEEDYVTLSKIINSELQQTQIREKARIYYLSVPPFAYEGIVKFINMYLRPMDSFNTKIRIVLEKPFGHDQKSAKSLGEEILKYFKEEQIYRVDHYLGKQTVDEVLKFRANNYNMLHRIWNNQFIESVEVVMKETVDCKGRTEFYNKYGVVLDVMQNHLTEVLARVLMPHPMQHPSQPFEQLKLQTLQSIFSPVPGMAVAGQYKNYTRHVMEDRRAEALDNSSTATYAVVVLHTGQNDWENVPLFMVSGKQLNEKSTYVKVNFKTPYILNSSASEDIDNNDNEKAFIKFYIHSSKYDGPAVEIQNWQDSLKLEF
eukprot:gene16792-18487_t